jgi:hypothetical protein
MGRHVDARLQHIQGKPLAMHGETVRKEFAGDAERFVAALFDDALRHAKLTPQQVISRLGYAHQSAVTRWTTGTDIPPFLVKFLTDKRLRRAFMVALADVPGDTIRARTVIDVPHDDCDEAAS